MHISSECVTRQHFSFISVVLLDAVHIEITSNGAQLMQLYFVFSSVPLKPRLFMVSLRIVLPPWKLMDFF
jgi:hypothetical protein